VNILRGAFVAAAVASLGLLTAGPALADPPLLNGVYNFNSDDGVSGTVTLSSTCAYDGCVAHAIGGKGYVQGDATLNGGTWTMSVTNPVGDICVAKDQSFPADQVYTFDAVTLRGTVVSTYGPLCDGIPGITSTGFTLTRA
jgi:hypothetical protein